jgi:hypothetical protein
MKLRTTFPAVLTFLTLAALTLLFVSVRTHAQGAESGTRNSSHNGPGDEPADKPYDWKSSFAKVPTGRVPRMADGKPDLQGIWSHSILTPLERPNGQKSTQVTAAQAAEEEEVAQQDAIALRVESTVTPPGEKTTDAYNSYWRDGYWYKVPMTVLHTSQVVDPPDGRLPPLTPEAQKRLKEVTRRINRPATGPEDRNLASRCIRPTGAGSPFIGEGPGSQETTFQIVQSHDVVVVRVEAHESQMIYLDGRPRPPENIRLDKGASRGHWDGDTLVVDYTNYKENGMYAFSGYGQGTTEKAHLTERWKRLDDTHMLYGFTVDDPGTWTKPWTVEYVMWRLTDQEQLVEYACHEGNVGIEFTLSAARAKEHEQQNENQGDNH